MAKMNIKPKSECTYDCISLGEVMLRLDPGKVAYAPPVNSGLGKAVANTTYRAASEDALGRKQLLSLHWLTTR